MNMGKFCDICGKSFRGHDPLTDGQGKYFHMKCAPKPDWAGMKKAIETLLRADGIDGVQAGSKRL